MPITLATVSCLEPIDTKTVSEVIAASAEGNYKYTTKLPRPDCDEDTSEIGNEKDDELNRRVDNNMPNGEDEYLYQLRAKRADRNRRIFTERIISRFTLKVFSLNVLLKTRKHSLRCYVQIFA